MAVQSAHLEPHWTVYLARYVRQLRRRWGMLFLVMLLLAGAAAAYLAVVPAQYRATTEVFLDPRGLQVVQNDVTPRLETSEVAISLVESQSRIAQSEALLLEVVRRLGLDRDPEFTRAGVLQQLRSYVLPPAREEEAAMRAMRKLQRAVDVHRATRSYVIVMSVVSEDPVKAARIADTIADVYLEREVHARKTAADRVETAMTSRLKELADRVRVSEDSVEDFKAEHNLIGAADRLISDQQLEELNSRLSAEHANAVQLRAKVQELERLIDSGVGADGSLEAVQSQTITSLRAQYAQVERRYSTASALLGRRHPDMQAIRQQRDGYKRLITEELERITEATRTEYNRAAASERSMREDLDKLKTTKIQSNEALVRLRELERVAHSNREIYQAFLVRAKEIGAQGNVDTSSTRVISAAIPPDRPSGPRTSLVLIAAFAGLMIGSGIVWLSDPRLSGHHKA